MLRKKLQKGSEPLDYRHEWKYRISYGDLLILRQRLQTVAQTDTHAANGSYHIRSLYFDTPGDTALREKLDGVSCREKFRIRYYNLDPSIIHLEKKSKWAGLGNKQSADLTAAQVQALLDGQTDWMQEAAPLVRELHAKMQTRLLQPKTVVDYVREPYVFAPGNVRVTLDYDIRTGGNCQDFLKKDCLTLPTDNVILLEVKWDEFLPDIIRDAIALEGRRAAAFSKYAQCRMYG